MSEQKTCFVIAPIGEPESETRKRSDQILKHVITPAANQCGYDPIRADQISEPGIITSQVIQHIVDDPLVIADLTGQNPNVFYELAIRHAVKKPLVQIIQKGEQIPFDVAPTRTIQLDYHDLDSVAEAKTEIVRQIEAVEKDPSKIDTPISVAVDWQALRQSDDPEQRSIASIEQAVNDLRITVLGLQKRLEASEIFRQYGLRTMEWAPYEAARVVKAIPYVEKLDKYEKRTLAEIALRMMRHKAERPITEEALARLSEAMCQLEELSTEEEQQRERDSDIPIP